MTWKHHHGKGDQKRRKTGVILAIFGHFNPFPLPCLLSICLLLTLSIQSFQEMCLRYRNTVIQPNGSDDDAQKHCTAEDLNEISRTTLLLMVEWAKALAPFPDLVMEDKIILLKNYAPQHLILMPAFR